MTDNPYYCSIQIEEAPPFVFDTKIHKSDFVEAIGEVFWGVLFFIPMVLILLMMMIDMELEMPKLFYATASLSMIGQVGVWCWYASLWQ